MTTAPVYLEKKDAVKTGSLKRLKHVLTEYVYNLHDKYLQSKPKFFFEIKTQAYPVKDTLNYINVSHRQVGGKCFYVTQIQFYKRGTWMIINQNLIC